ncbi:amidohydrolase family protein [Pseudonocardia sp. HH130630-07]|uniref:amidohydrolase family protein n=1 Tax=Pseudonocardia sp. HH130630-07 TaxID=1690815 RepID=UPI000814F2D2|nr:amidohydrolase family protein [Pseudonocardia sp. HH130630-07]ANY09012.1 hypothetical protein AFB00_25160 [Pseudonocardia sp. HH130630-07]
MFIVDADRILVGPVGEVLPGAGVLVDGAVIAEVGPVEEILRRHPGVPRSAHPGRTLLPGLVNSHVHLAADLSRDPFGTVRAGDRPVTRALVERNARACLRAGCTTVRDLGDAAGVVAEVRDDPRGADLPRILTAGTPLTITGGHCWFLGGVADTESELRAAIDRTAGTADLVKIMAGGGQMTPGGPSQYEPQYPAELLRVVVEHAAQHGLPVAAHAHGTVPIIRCVDAGVSTVEHCGWHSGAGRTDRSDSHARSMARHGIVAGNTTAPQWRDMAARTPIPEGTRFGDQWVWMHEHGVPIVIGTDSGMPNAVFDGFRAGLEMFEELGFDRDWIIGTATSGAAARLGLGDRTGAVRPGLAADLVVVDGDPRDDLDRLHRPVEVVAGGRRHTQDDLVAEPRERPAR